MTRQWAAPPALIVTYLALATPLTAQTSTLNPLPASVEADAAQYSLRFLGELPFYSGTAERPASIIWFGGRGDLNSDGVEDLVLSGWTIDQRPYDPNRANPPAPVRVVRSTGNGWLLLEGEAIGISQVYGTAFIAIEDFSNDARPDIFFPGHTDYPVIQVPSTLAIQQSDGTFTTQPMPRKVASHQGDLVDIDGDGRRDLVLGNYPGNIPPSTPRTPLVVYRNTVGGLVEAVIDEDGPTAVAGSAASACDVDADGQVELLTFDAPYVTLSGGLDDGAVLEGIPPNPTGHVPDYEATRLPMPYFDADPAYAAAPSFFGTMKSHDIAAKAFDFDHDGRVDVALSSMIWSSAPWVTYPDQAVINLYHNVGAGQFVLGTSERLWNWRIHGKEAPHTLHVLDVNRDGHLDLVGVEAPFVALGIDGHYQYVPGSTGSEVLVNDGTGRFVSVLWTGFDAMADRIYADLETRGLVLNRLGGKFHPVMGPGDRIRWLVAMSYYNTMTGAFLDAHFEMDPGMLGTGPSLTDGAAAGAPGFSEVYYLLTYPDVRAAVVNGAWTSGLAHYLALGRGENRYAFAPGTIVWGSGGNDLIVLREGDETAHAGAGDDELRGGGGNDRLDGGAGSDTVVYGGARGMYRISWTSDGIDVIGPDGNDRLVAIERVVFADGPMDDIFANGFERALP